MKLSSEKQAEIYTLIKDLETLNHKYGIWQMAHPYANDTEKETLLAYIDILRGRLWTAIGLTDDTPWMTKEKEAGDDI